MFGSIAIGIFLQVSSVVIQRHGEKTAITNIPWRPPSEVVKGSITELRGAKRIFVSDGGVAYDNDEIRKGILRSLERELPRLVLVNRPQDADLVLEYSRGCMMFSGGSTESFLGGIDIFKLVDGRARKVFEASRDDVRIAFPVPAQCSGEQLTPQCVEWYERREYGSVLLFAAAFQRENSQR